MTRSHGSDGTGFTAYDQLDPADSLVGDLGADPLDDGYILPSEPSLTTRWGNTLDEMRAGESLDQLLEEEEPEIDVDESAAPNDNDNDSWQVCAEVAAIHVIDERGQRP